MSLIDEVRAGFDKAINEASSAAYDARAAAEWVIRLQTEARQRALELAIQSTPQDPHTGAKSEGAESICKRAAAFYVFLTGDSPSQK